jgi:hypothetical protein
MSFFSAISRMFNKNESKCAGLQVRDSRFKSIEDKLESMKMRAEEFCQSRTNFQLEKFLACDEYSPIMKFRHVAHNSHVAMQEARKLIIERERKLREMQQKEKEIIDSGDPHHKNYDLDIYEVNRYLEDLEIRIKGMLREVDYMERICDQLEKENGRPFTMGQLEDEQPEYWRRRFARQSLRSIEASRSGVNEGNIHSIWMATEKPILLDSKNQMRPLNYYDANELGYTTFQGIRGLEELYLKKLDDKKKGMIGENGGK